MQQKEEVYLLVFQVWTNKSCSSQTNKKKRQAFLSYAAVILWCTILFKVRKLHIPYHNQLTNYKFCSWALFAPSTVRIFFAFCSDQ